MFKHKLLGVLILIVLLLGVSQTALAGSNLITAVTASCVGDDVFVEITASGNYWTAEITWTGTSAGYVYTASNPPVNPSSGYTISGPGTFEIIVVDQFYGDGAGTFNLESITCPEGEAVTTQSQPIEERIELCADGRTNSNLCDPLAIYPVESDDGVGMLIYRTSRDNGGIGQFALYVPAEELDSLPASVDEACTIDASADGSVVVYLLTSGEIQVNVGPDEEGKFFVFRYESFPSMPEVETYSGGGSLPIFPSCWDETEVSFGASSMPF